VETNHGGINHYLVDAFQKVYEDVDQNGVKAGVDKKGLDSFMTLIHMGSWGKTGDCPRLTGI